MLTRVVDGVQADSSGSDETANSLQLTMSYIVLEDNVVGEVDTADWLQSGRVLAADWFMTAFGVILDSYGLRHRALIVLHLRLSDLFLHKKQLSPSNNLPKTWFSSNRINRMRFFRVYEQSVVLQKDQSGLPSLSFSLSSVPCDSTVAPFFWGPSVPVVLFILSAGLF